MRSIATTALGQMHRVSAVVLGTLAGKPKMRIVLGLVRIPTKWPSDDVDRELQRSWYIARCELLIERVNEILKDPSSEEIDPDPAGVLTFLRDRTQKQMEDLLNARARGEG